MSNVLEQLSQLPSPFYRVGVKALVFDDQHRLAVLVSEDDEVEIPGGGLEHGESIEECVVRELAEEMHAQVVSISPVLFTFHGKSRRGWHTFRLVVRATLLSLEGLQADDGLKAIRFVTKQEFAQLPHAMSSRNIAAYTDTIWSEEE